MLSGWMAGEGSGRSFYLLLTLVRSLDAISFVLLSFLCIRDYRVRRTRWGGHREGVLARVVHHGHGVTRGKRRLLRPDGRLCDCLPEPLSRRLLIVHQHDPDHCALGSPGCGTASGRGRGRKSVVEGKER